ncbi:MAG: ribonuclease P protein component [Prevotella sp.]|nr:ribonuclease P protein component [Prevotella sp.]
MTGLASPTFSKRERIVSRKLIEQLFSKGSNHSTSAFPIRIVYMEKEREEDEEPVQILVSVSKRHFKRAVKRNRVKRQIREAYRHHKQILAEKMPQDTSLAIAFIWLADELLDSQQVEKSVKRLLEKVAENI